MGSCLSWLSQSGEGWLAVIFGSGNSSLGTITWHVWPAIWLCVQMITMLASATDRISGHQFPDRKRSFVSLPLQECKKTKWPASLTAIFPLFCTLHMFIVSSGCWVRMELRLHKYSLGCPQVQVPIMLSLSYAEVSRKKISGFHIPDE